MREGKIYAFGDVRVDLTRMAATRDGVPIPLEPKAFDVLVHLIEHRDRIVAKDELLEAVWTGTFVTPNVLTRAVAQVRKGLGDESDNARFIETVAKRGYRFIAPVTVVDVASSDAAPPLVAPALDPAPSAALPPPRVPPRRWLAVAALVSAVAALVILVSLFALRSRVPAAESSSTETQLKRLTNRRGFSGTPALSRDGRAIVYSSDVSGGLELYLASFQGGAEVPLTKDGGHNVQPAWSPDGQWIAFHSRKRGGVWIVPATGGEAQQVVDFGSDPAWSPGSDEIVFTSDAGGLAGQSSLWIVRRDGSERRPLTKVGDPAGGHRAPAWSHDGRHVAFIVTRGGWRMDVRVVDVATGTQRLVDESNQAADPAFTPDDRALLWGGSTLTGNGRLYRHAIDADGNPVGDTEVVVPMDAGVIDGLTVASNGTVAFAAGASDANLWKVGVAPTATEPVRLTDDLSRSTHPIYISEGRVAYMQTAIGSLPTTWVTGDDGSNRGPLLPGTPAGNPEPDTRGNRLLLIAYRGPAAIASPLEFIWVDLASRRITRSDLPVREMASVRLSPDASRIAFHVIEKSGGISVWTSTFDGVRTKVASDAEAVSYPAWSPDGRALAVELKRGDSTQIGVVAAGGGAIEQLTTDRGQSWPHTWAPDNDRIAFAGQRGGVWNVYTISRRTRAVTQITFFTSAAGYVRYPAFSPSGSSIVFERGIETANVWTMSLPADK
jgi:Tol biopolymer transport system component/DNA-binding winged helix-turn-helix (wHTH) protein